ADFLNQWQAQMTRQMHNPDVIRALLSAMQSFAGANAHDETTRKSAPSTDAHDAAIARLARRLDAVERRLDELARLVSVVAETQKPAGTKPRRRTEPVEQRKRPVATGRRGDAKKPSAKPATPKRGKQQAATKPKPRKR